MIPRAALSLLVLSLLAPGCGGDGWAYRPRDAAGDIADDRRADPPDGPPSTEAPPDVVPDAHSPPDDPQEAGQDVVGLQEAEVPDAPLADAASADALDAPPDAPPDAVAADALDAPPDAVAADALDALDALDAPPDAVAPDVSDAGCPAGTARCGAACVSLQSDPAHCGACGAACAPPGASGRCEGGRCLVGSCAPGLADCNGSPVDGCEADVSTSSRCGSCSFACGLGASAACASGRCVGPSVAWAARVGGGPYVDPRDVAVDPSGNRYVLGRFRGECAFGGDTLASPGAESGFLASLGPGGAPRWARALGAEAISPYAVAATDSVVVAVGWAPGRVDLGGGASAGPGGFAAAYDAAGALRWARTWPAAGPARVAAAPGGGACIAGSLDGPSDFGGGALDPASGPSFVACLGPDGAHRWSRALPAPSIARALAVDGGGGVLVAGAASGGLGAAATSLAPGGAQRWARVLVAAPARADIAAAAFAPDGGAYLAGDGRGDVDAGAAGVLALGARGAVAFALDGAGSVRWARGFPAADRSRSALASGAAADPAGGVLLGGVFDGAVDFGAGPLRAAAPDRSAAFALSLTAAGAHRWSLRLGQGGNRAVSVAADRGGSLAVLGVYGSPGFETDAASLAASASSAFAVRVDP